MSNTETKDKRLKSYWIRKDLLEQLAILAKQERRSEAWMINKAIEFALRSMLEWDTEDIEASLMRIHSRIQEIDT